MTEKLLRLVGPLHVAGGLLVFLTAFIPAAASWLETTFGGVQGLEWSGFFVAILGPTIASWGLLFGTLVNEFYRAPSMRIWKALVWAVALWAPLDTALCLKVGLLAGAALNGVVVIALAALLFAAKPGPEQSHE